MTDTPEELRKARDLRISQDRAYLATTALQGYVMKSSSTDLQAALLNFLVDFLHLCAAKGSTMTADQLKAIVDQAAVLHSAEESLERRSGSVSLAWLA